MEIIEFNYINDIITYCKNNNKTFPQAIIEYEMFYFNKSYEEVIKNTETILNIMEESINYGLKHNLKSRSGLIDNFAKKVLNSEKTVLDKNFKRLIAYAMSVSEVNACMGRIAAAPTAGSSGILPSVLFTMKELHNLDKNKLIEGLIVAGGVGLIISKNASLAGAEAGCMAEVGSAVAMGAAAITYMLDGTLEQITHAISFGIQGLLGLICDPVAGLVEIPCIFRNAIGVTCAMSAAQIALADIPFFIPTDEVIMTMNEVAQLMSVNFKETAQGGLANTKTAQIIKQKIFKKEK